MHRLILFLSAGRPAAIERHLLEHEHEFAAIAGSVGGSLRLAVRLDDDPLAASSDEGRVIRPLDGLIEVTIPDGDLDGLVDAAGAISTLFDDSVDRDASAASIGVVREVLPAASDVVLLTLAANRLPTIDRAAFHAYWLDVHATLAMSLLDDDAKVAMGYQQIHADEAASTAAAAAAGVRASSFDGVLQCGLSQLADLPHLTVPGFADTIRKDEENFADQSAEMLGAFMRTLNHEGMPS
jgi:hypothetical protein